MQSILVALLLAAIILVVGLLSQARVDVAVLGAVLIAGASAAGDLTRRRRCRSRRVRR